MHFKALLPAALFVLLFLSGVAAEWGQYIITYDTPKYYMVDTRGMKGAEVRIKATVVEGSSVDIFLVDDENKTSYENSGHVFYIRQGSALNVTDFSAELTLRGGEIYWFIFQVHIDENTSLQEAVRMASTVQWEINVEEVKEKKAPIYLLVGGVILLALGVALIIRAKILKEKAAEEAFREEIKKEERGGGPRGESVRPEVHRGSTDDRPERWSTDGWR